MMAAIVEVEAVDDARPGGADLADPDAFCTFYLSHVDRIYGYFVHRCRGVRSVAEDLTQKTFAAAVRELRQHLPQHVAASWPPGLFAELDVTRRIAQRRRVGAVGPPLGPGWSGRSASAMMAAERGGPMVDAVVGRDGELQTITGWLDIVPSAPTALLVEGEAGIGKTTVLLGGVEATSARGWRVLVTRPTEAEASLSFAGLADLLDPVADAVLHRLPAPQREALEVALLRRPAGQRPPDPRTVGAGTLACLRALAEERPLVVAVDDLQWLDAATGRALAFAVRRLGSEPVGVLLARRATPGGPAPWDLDSLRMTGEVHRLAVGPLDAVAVAALLQRHLAWAPPRATLLALYEASGGNPLFALELGRALQHQPETAPGQPLPVPDRLRDLVSARLRRLGTAHRETLVAAAALRRPTVALLDALTGDPVSVVEALEAAEGAALASRRGEVVVFAHPLYASVLYASTAPARRRELHRRLADVVADAEERARHLALAAAGPDEVVAAALEDASRLARGRGAPEAAADLAELAVRLTPGDAVRAGWRRRLVAAQHHVDAQQPDRARPLLEALAAAGAPADVRADALFLLSTVEIRDTGPPGAKSLAEQALAVLGAGETPRHAIMLTVLGFWSLGGEWPAEEAVSHTDRAMQIAHRVGDFAGEAWARLIHVFAKLVAGHGLDLDELERTPGLDTRVIGINFRGAALTFSGRHEEARRWLEDLRALNLQLGGGPNHVVATQQLAEVEWRDGNWDRAWALGQETLGAAVQGGQLAMGPLVAGYMAVTAASRGRLEDAWALVEKWEQVAAPSGYVPGIAYMAWARGFVHLCADTPEQAVDALERAWTISERYGHREHYVLFRPDLVEALIRSGDLERAEQILSLLEERGSAFPVYGLVSTLRCRALLAAARGELEAGLEAGERAAALLERLPMPFEAARTLLVHGTVLRRARKKRAARGALDQATERFRALGATLWERRADAELQRLGLRPTTSLELTPTEERVATLVAEGRSNSEIATALSIAVRTVEANLTRIYRKLGVGRRTELVRLLTTGALVPVGDLPPSELSGSVAGDARPAGWRGTP